MCPCAAARLAWLPEPNHSLNCDLAHSAGKLYDKSVSLFCGWYPSTMAIKTCVCAIGCACSFICPELAYATAFGLSSQTSLQSQTFLPLLMAHGSKPFFDGHRKVSRWLKFLLIRRNVWEEASWLEWGWSRGQKQALFIDWPNHVIICCALSYKPSFGYLGVHVRFLDILPQGH